MRLVWLSDMDQKGSGYFNISTKLCEGLAKLGHEVKAIGLGYTGGEHNYNFSIIPATNMQEAMMEVQNLYNVWKFQVLIVALDISIQEPLLANMQTRPFKYVGIMPLEAPPLCMSWAMVLMNMDKSLIISQFGTEEVKKTGILNVEYFPIGIDLDMWKVPTKAEKKAFRKGLGFEEDEFVILTVADNQERKNLGKAFEIFKAFSEKTKARYALVTRVQNFVGWRLDDLALEMSIHKKVMKFERGIPHQNLWAIYASADAFMLTSKAEGLGMPLLEAMAMKIPCLGTNCTAIAEVLGEDRGRLIEYDYVYRDPFGNGNRYFASWQSGVEQLKFIKDNRQEVSIMVNKAHKYVEKRTWDIPINQLDKIVKSYDVEKK